VDRHRWPVTGLYGHARRQRAPRERAGAYLCFAALPHAVQRPSGAVVLPVGANGSKASRWVCGCAISGSLRDMLGEISARRAAEKSAALFAWTELLTLPTRADAYAEANSARSDADPDPRTAIVVAGMSVISIARVIVVAVPITK